MLDAQPRPAPLRGPLSTVKAESWRILGFHVGPSLLHGGAVVTRVTKRNELTESRSGDSAECLARHVNRSLESSIPGRTI